MFWRIVALDQLSRLQIVLCCCAPRRTSSSFRDYRRSAFALRFSLCSWSWHWTTCARWDRVFQVKSTQALARQDRVTSEMSVEVKCRVLRSERTTLSNLWVFVCLSWAMYKEPPVNITKIRKYPPKKSRFLAYAHAPLYQNWLVTLTPFCATSPLGEPLL